MLLLVVVVVVVVVVGGGGGGGGGGTEAATAVTVVFACFIWLIDHAYLSFNPIKVSFERESCQSLTL